MEKFLEIALLAVEAAKTITLSYWGKSPEELEYETKLDDLRFVDDHQKSPVTRADKEAEHAIKDSIKKQFPDHGFVGEEEGNEHENADYKRIIDPIDGTRNFARGLPYRAILLALSCKGEIIVAVVCTPVLGDLIRAMQGGGCFWNGEQVQVSDRSLSEAYIGHSRSHYFEKLGLGSPFTSLCSKVRYTKSCISWEMLYVATGSLDAVVNTGGGYYDNAPFKLLVEEAGGTVTSLSGGVFGHEDTSMIVSNGVVHEEIVAVLARK